MDAASGAIGPYRLLEILGEGGMGVVYLAEQTEPVRRNVALKVLRPGAGSAEAIARFDAERQALAIMDHPSIAKIFDAGTTEDGQLYFAMEVVTGAPLARYCDDHRLTIRERIQLFVEICHAVQHAHQKGVIHRDLKPSNILVAESDGRAHPRIIDFGIAKATGATAFDGTQLTRDDQVIGTPAYMSPEQIDGAADVDTRTDIYSLGVILYEVLLGALPYDASAYRGWAAVAAHMHRDPPTPAKRFAELADTQHTISRARSTTPTQLRKDLTGDIGWIVSRAMERDPSRRYETVNAMALDLERLLSHEPVRARGATTAYVVRKFVRRNRLGVTFALTMVAGLIGFSIVTAVQADRVARARDDADARRGQAERLIDFMLTDLRDKLSPIGRLDVLDDVGQEATRYFASIPEEQFTDAELASRSQALYQIGSVRLDQGDFASAVTAFTESLRLALALSTRAPDDLDRLFGLSQSHFYVGYASWLEADLPAAETEFLNYLSAAERLVELEPANPAYQLEVGFAHGNLGSVREQQGDLAGAADEFILTLDVLRGLVEEDGSNILWLGELAETRNKFGVVLRKQGQYTAALEQHQLELDLKRRILELQPEHAYWRLRSAVALRFVAEARRVTGDLSSSLSFLEQESAILDSLVSTDPSNAGWRRNRAVAQLNTAGLLTTLGRYPEARSRLDLAEREMAALVRSDSTSFGWSVDLARVFTGRAALYLSQPGALRADALEAATRAVSLVTESESTADRTAVLARARLARGRALEALGRSDEAAVEWEEALDGLERFEGGVNQGEFRPLRTEALLLLGRVDRGLEELRTLQDFGYVDAALEGLAESRVAATSG